MAANGFFKILDSVDSTNNYAMAMVREGMAIHGTAIIAKEQTAGKGQRGKNWQMEPGQNIATSLILNTAHYRADQQFLMSMLVSLGVHDFLKKFVPLEVTIKWPNDLYWRDRKAGGILIETVLKGTSWQWAIVGIGININQTVFDPGLPNPVSLQQITHKNYDCIEMAKLLYNAVMHRLNSAAQKPAAEILKEYNSHLYKRNEKVKLKKANAVFETTVRSVTLQGRLQTMDSMERQFDFGEVKWIT
jgi:BirA family biotin operon repressor/biotin-[acetyl-CoA-carboxylase] ligase